MMVFDRLKFVTVVTLTGIRFRRIHSNDPRVRYSIEVPDGQFPTEASILRGECYILKNGNFAKFERHPWVNRQTLIGSLTPLGISGIATGIREITVREITVRGIFWFWKREWVDGMVD